MLSIVKKEVNSFAWIRNHETLGLKAVALPTQLYECSDDEIRSTEKSLIACDINWRNQGNIINERNKNEGNNIFSFSF